MNPYTQPRCVLMLVVAMTVMVSAIGATASAQRENPVWICQSLDGVRGAQDRPCLDDAITLRTPEGFATPVPSLAPPTSTPRPTTAIVMPRIIAPAVADLLSPQTQESGRTPRTDNPFAPLITMVWGLVGVLIVILLLVALLKLVSFKRSLMRILFWLGLVAKHQSKVSSTSDLPPWRRHPAGRGVSAPTPGGHAARQSQAPGASNTHTFGTSAEPPISNTPHIRRPSPDLTDWSMDVLHALEWRRFETLVERYWQMKGHDATSTGPGADGGVDVILRNRENPESVFAVIQCKSWATSPVDVETVRALWGAHAHFSAKLALFYTVYGYTAAAKAFAAGKHLKLFDGADLLAQVQTLAPEDRQSLLREITDGDYSTPSCPQCESNMVLRKGKERKRDFWGCPNYPRCRGGTQGVRS